MSNIVASFVPYVGLEPAYDRKVKTYKIILKQNGTLFCFNINEKRYGEPFLEFKIRFILYIYHNSVVSGIDKIDCFKTKLN